VTSLGVAITIPGVDASVIQDFLQERMNADDNGQSPGAAVGALLNVFSGGGLEKCGIFALGIMPYISASIMMQLGTAVIPQLSKLSREDGGRQKITQYTRYITIIIALVQSYMIAKSLQNPGSIPYLSGIGDGLVPNYGTSFVIIAVITMVAGTMFLAWIGDQITDRGIGQGVSLIISVNIIAAFPGAMVQAWTKYVSGPTAGPFSPIILVGLFAFLLFVTAATIAITQANRRIAVQYAGKVNRKSRMEKQTQYLPLKVNYAGVMPIIFASAILTFPTIILGFLFKEQPWVNSVQDAMGPDSWIYYIIAGIMIFFFSYFWVSTFFNPTEISENLKKSGGYIPGVRAGKPTAQFLDFTMTRLTFAGSIFLTIIFILPMLLMVWLNMPYMVTQFFGGTSLLILVGVLLDMMRQIETHLLQRNYDGFLRKGKVKGRYDRLQQKRGAATSTSGNTVTYLWIGIAVIALLAIVAYTIQTLSN